MAKFGMHVEFLRDFCTGPNIQLSSDMNKRITVTIQITHKKHGNDRDNLWLFERWHGPFATSSPVEYIHIQ
jgi:hypothetical protein